MEKTSFWSTICSMFGGLISFGCLYMIYSIEVLSPEKSFKVIFSKR